MKFQVSQGCYGYPKQENVLQDIELTINKGEVLAILGANGIGKTTLLKCMMGLLPWKEGQSLIEGKDIKEISHKELWRRI